MTKKSHENCWASPRTWRQLSPYNNNNNNYDNLYGAVMRPYRYKGVVKRGYL